MSTVLFAQNLSIGFKDGISWTGIHFNMVEASSFRYDSRNDGRNSGVLINYRINNYFSIQTELNLLGKGFVLRSYLSTGGGFYADYNLNYISVPLSVSYELGKKLKYYGYAGLYFNY